ncbi:MAG: GNAT family N-acetyltransferase [Planctomycetota bacterium]|nr:MAG: GNAT family N-acetyltransferase [Planctomycetota bacterium]
MTVTYFKRYRMELSLDSIPDEVVATCHLPEGFELVGWDPAHLSLHAEVKWRSFSHEIDAHVFPCLAERQGCKQLMREISERENFVPQATWLAVRRNPFEGPQPCGTIQGLRASPREGAIQNIGVDPTCRGLGIGRCLLLAALRGFAEIGCRYVNLEVTVQNVDAIRLYTRFGFRRVETLYKVSDVQYA